MAITDLGPLGIGGSHNADQSSLTMVTSAAVAAGELIVVVTAVDVNGTSSGIDMSTYALRMGGPTGTLFQDKRGNQPGTGSQTGVASTLWWMIADKPYPSGTTIWAGFNSPTESDHSAIIARHFSIGMSNVVVDSWTSNFQTAAVDPPAMSVSSGYGFQCLRIRSSAGRHVGTSANATYGVTTDWSSFGLAVSGLQAATANWEVSAFAEFLFTNAPGGPGSLTSDPTIVTPCVSTNIYVAFREGTVPIITGTLAATEAADGAGFSGISNTNYGSFGTTEVADVASFAGNLSPVGTIGAYEGAVWLRADSTLYTADDNITRVNTAGQVTDTASFAGKASERYGVLTVTEAADVAAFAGTVVSQPNIGTLAATEAADTASFTGGAVVAGTLAVTEGADTAAFSGGLGVVGALAATEGADTANIHGVSGLVAGTLAVTEGADTAAFAATAGWAAVLAATEGADTAAFSGKLGAVGTLAATEAGQDVLAFEGYRSMSNEKVGILNAFESGNVYGFKEPTADSTLVTADMTIFTVDMDNRGGDTARFVVDVRIGATMAATEYADYAFFEGVVAVAGVLSAREDSDTAAFSGDAMGVIHGILAAQESGSDTAYFLETLLWEQIGEGLRNEVQRTIWLSGLGGRVTWLENEVEDTSGLQDIDPEVVSLVAEQRRITELRP